MKPPVGLTGNKRQKIWQLKQENKELRECLEALVDLYVIPYKHLYRDVETSVGRCGTGCDGY